MENKTPKYWSLLAGGLYLEAVVSLGLTVVCAACVTKSNDIGLRFEIGRGNDLSGSQVLVYAK